MNRRAGWHCAKHSIGAGWIVRPVLISAIFLPFKHQILSTLKMKFSQPDNPWPHTHTHKPTQNTKTQTFTKRKHQTLTSLYTLSAYQPGEWLSSVRRRRRWRSGLPFEQFHWDRDFSWTDKHSGPLKCSERPKNINDKWTKGFKAHVRN